MFYFVFMFTTSGKKCSNNKLIEQPYIGIIVIRKGHSPLEKFIITPITSTKLNDDVSSHYLHFAKQSQGV